MVLRLQDGKVRRRNDWMNWPPLPPAANSPHAPDSPSPDALAARVRNTALEDGASAQSTPWAAPQAAALGTPRGEMSSSGSSPSPPATIGSGAAGPPGHGAGLDGPDLSSPQEP